LLRGVSFLYIINYNPTEPNQLNPIFHLTLLNRIRSPILKRIQDRKSTHGAMR
jgi:hypothetical protein